MYSTVINNASLFSTGVFQFILPPAGVVSVTLYPHQHLELSGLKVFTNLICMCRYPIVVLNCLFLMTNDIEYLIKCLLTIGYLFCKCLLKSMAIFLLSCLYFSYWFIYIFFIFWTKVFSWSYVLEISSEACLLAILITSFFFNFYATLYFFWTYFANRLLTEIFHVEHETDLCPISQTSILSFHIHFLLFWLKHTHI